MYASFRDKSLDQYLRRLRAWPWGNLMLRVLTIALRFLLIFYIGKFYTASNLGIFSLFGTTTAIAVMLLGFDFYAFSQREIIGQEKGIQFRRLIDQLAFWAISYFLFLPVTYFVFLSGVLPIELTFWFYCILVFEHLSQELFRLLIAIRLQFVANVLFFIRTSAWVIPVFAYWYWSDFADFTLDIIWICWFVGSMLSVIIGFIWIGIYYRGYITFGPVDWRWIESGFYVTIPFITCTVAYKIVEYSSRYFIDLILSKADVGIFSFFMNIVNVMQTFVYTLVIQEMYPRLTELYLTDSSEESIKEYQEKFFRGVVSFSLIGLFGLAIVIFPLMHFLNRSDFAKELPAYFVLLVGAVLMNLSFVPHYILYARRKDNIILNATLISAGISLVANFFMISYFGILGAAISFFISSLMLYVFKQREL